MISRLIRKIKRHKKQNLANKIQQKFLTALKEIDSDRLIILDLGFNTGSVYDVISKNLNFDKYHGFEMQRDLVTAVNSKSLPKLTLHHAAVVGSDITYTHYYEPKSWSQENFKDGATIVENKINSKGSTIQTPAIRLTRWITENIASDKTVVLKIDIEGAEYEVLEDLAESAAVNQIHTIAVEWHCRKFGVENEAQYVARKNQIKIKLWQHNIQVIYWF